MLVGDNLSKDILQNCKGCSEVRGINFVQLFDLITVQRKCDIILIINDVTIISISFLNRTGKNSIAHEKIVYVSYISSSVLFEWLSI